MQGVQAGAINKSTSPCGQRSRATSYSSGRELGVAQLCTINDARGTALHAVTHVDSGEGRRSTCGASKLTAASPGDSRTTTLPIWTVQRVLRLTVPSHRPDAATWLRMDQPGHQKAGLPERLLCRPARRLPVMFRSHGAPFGVVAR